MSLLSLCFTVQLLVALPLRAQQNTADVVGTVSDDTGAVLPGATVTLTNTGTNITQTAVTGPSGDYIFNLVQVGTYRVKVEAKGFKTFEAPSLSVSSGDRARVDAKMQVGEQSSTIEVQATATPALQSDSATLGTLVTTQAVEDVPLNGRNVTKLVQLAVGVNTSSGGFNAGLSPDDRRQTSAFSANGQNDEFNNNMIDGMDNNERVIGTVGVRPSVDAIQEVNVSTNMYDASVGRTGGGVVDVVTKSGTNSFHGSTYEFFRNAVLNTNPNYAFPSGYCAPNATTCTPGTLLRNSALAKPAFRQNQYGASIGGPIKRNKTFFFGDFEQFRQAYGLPETSTVPTLCERGLAICPDGKMQLGDFTDTNAISAFGGSAGPGAANSGPVIPAGSINPIGLAYFNMYPLPTNTSSLTNNFTYDPLRTQNSTTFDTRIDQQISSKDTFYGRYSYNNVNTLTPTNLPNVTLTSAQDPLLVAGKPVTLNPGGTGSGNGFAGPSFQRQQQMSVSYVHIYSANLILNLKAAYLRTSTRSLGPEYGTYIGNALGFPCNAVSCTNTDLFSSGLPVIALAGGTNPSISLGDSHGVPLLQFDNTFQYTAGVNWNKGPHSFKFGMVLIRRRVTIHQGDNAQGSWAFSGGYTGVPDGDLLEGLSTGGQGGVFGMRSTPLLSPGLRTWEPAAYVQDDWRARHWLTLNLGMRYDIYTPYTEVRGRISNFNPANGLIMAPSLPGAQQSNATAGVGTSYLDVAPRFGFEASLPHSMVLRGGFGLSYFPTNYASQFAEKNPPLDDFLYNCTAQNEINTNTPCPAPFANGATIHYGPPATSASSTVNQTGGSLISAGVPVPVANVAAALQPASCPPGTTLPSFGCTADGGNSYATFSIAEATYPNYVPQYVEQFNLQLEKEFSGNVVTIGYVGTLGRHLGGSYTPNVISNYTQTQLPLAAQFPWLATTSITEAGVPWGTTSYNGLQTTFVRRFKAGLTVNVNYTWAHAMQKSVGSCTPTVSFSLLGLGSGPAYKNPCFYDNPSNPSSPIAITQWANQFGVGNSGTDIRDRLAGTINYELPFGRAASGQ